MNKRFNEKGITLLALVITIIVLILLATVAISSIKNEGIIDKTEKARFINSVAELKEKIRLAQYEKLLEEKSQNGSSSTINYSSLIPKDLIDYIEVNERGTTIIYRKYGFARSDLGYRNWNTGERTI